jgi:hypothetical protein
MLLAVTQKRFIAESSCSEFNGATMAGSYGPEK